MQQKREKVAQALECALQCNAEQQKIFIAS